MFGIGFPGVQAGMGSRATMDLGAFGAAWLVLTGSYLHCPYKKNQDMQHTIPRGQLCLLLLRTSAYKSQIPDLIKLQTENSEASARARHAARCGMRKAIRATRAPSDYLKADGTKLRVLWYLDLERLYFPGYSPGVSLMCYGATAFEESAATPATSVRLLRAFLGFSVAPPAKCLSKCTCATFSWQSSTPCSASKSSSA